jgi:hypothetical protein
LFIGVKKDYYSYLKRNTPMDPKARLNLKKSTTSEKNVNTSPLSQAKGVPDPFSDVHIPGPDEHKKVTLSQLPPARTPLPPVRPLNSNPQNNGWDLTRSVNQAYHQFSPKTQTSSPTPRTTDAPPPQGVSSPTQAFIAPELTILPPVVPPAQQQLQPLTLQKTPSPISNKPDYSGFSCRYEIFDGPDGLPAAGARLELEPLTNELAPIIHGQVDEQGIYLAMGIAPGTYSMTIRFPGCIPLNAQRTIILQRCDEGRFILERPGNRKLK